MLLLALSCVCDCDVPEADTGITADSGQADTGPPDSGAPDWPLSWDDDPCAAVSAEGSVYTDTIARWAEQDAQHPPAVGGTVFVGSSSIRRWQRLSTDLSGWGVIQRGFGGGWLSEVAAFAPELITVHAPQAVVVFAGTNDVAGGSTSEMVVTAYRCLAQQVWQEGGEVPVLFIGITPTPSRWEQWEASAAVNAAVAALAEQHPGLHYIDTPAAFLQTGQPPTTDLFVEDQLHLSAAGYALWTAVIQPALAGVVPAASAAPDNPAHPASGARVLIDLGPDNAEDGARTTSPDRSGLVWNSWLSVAGGEAILPGEALRGLLTTAGDDSGFELVIGGGFLSNGFANGGLVSPDPALLGALAVGSATGDFFYVDGPDNPGALTIGGLDPSRRYGLRLFGSRDWGSEERQTRYTVAGAAIAEQSLQTSGPGVGESTDGNEREVASFSGLAPDAWGRLHIDLAISTGTYAYLNLMELSVE